MTEDPQESPKRQRIAEPDSKTPEMPFLKGSVKRELFAMPWEKDDEVASPKKQIKSIQEMFPGGDELEAEKILQEVVNDISEDEENGEAIKDRPPELSDEELKVLDTEACKIEEERVEKMGVLRR